MSTKTSTSKIVHSCLDVCKAAKVPLTVPQEILLVGALAVWLEKVREEGRQEGLEQGSRDVHRGVTEIIRGIGKAA